MTVLALERRIEGEGGELEYSPIWATMVASVRTLGEMAVDPELTSPPDWVVKPFFERGTLNSVYGIGKGGKSTLLAHLAVHVGRGRDFADYAVTKGRVLWVDLEQGPRRLVRNFSAIAEFAIADVIVYSNLRQKLGVGHIQMLLEEYVPSLVVIDSLSKFCEVADDNDNAAWQVALAPLEELARGSSAAFVVIDHDRKGEGESGRAMRGASSKLAAFDTAIHVRRGEGNVRRLDVVSREIGDFSVSLERTEAGYRVAGGSRDRIAEALAATGDAVSANVLHHAMQRQGYSVGLRTVRDRLKYLAERGLADESGTGAKNDPKLYTWRKNDGNP